MSYEYIWLIKCTDGMGYCGTVGCAKPRKTALRVKEDAKELKWVSRCAIKKRRLPI